MSSFDLSEFEQEFQDAIIADLNGKKIFHTYLNSVLDVSLESDGIVAEIIGKRKTLHAAVLSVIDAPQLRYDFSELDDLVATAVRHDLEVDGIDYFYDTETKILTVLKEHENRVDEHISFNESYVRESDEAQHRSRLEKTGNASPICELCGTSPAAPIELRRQVALVVVRQTYRAEAILCESCARTAYAKFQKSTALKGWTGVLSALTNPLLIGSNVVNKQKHKNRLRKCERGNS